MEQEATKYPSAVEMQEDERLMLAERLQVFASRLSRLAKEQVAKKQQIESRWLEDIRQYQGQYTPGELSKLRAKEGSEVFVNITRNKTNAAEARLQDMLFPTDDRNWGIQPTPVPDIEIEAASLASPDMPPETVSRLKFEQASMKAQAMQDQIDDQLLESRFQPKCRDMIHDACQLGTGIIKGPVVMGRTKRRWDTLPDGTSMLTIEEMLGAGAERVDPWDFFPDMSGRTVDEAEFFFEKKRLSKKQMREFAQLPGVLVDQVRQVVSADAGGTHLARDYTDDIRSISGINTVGEGNKYEVWEYHGPISKTELIDALAGSKEDMPDEEEIDALDDEIDAIVFFSGESVLKVVINPMETMDRPYSVFNWEKDESSIFGFGVPYLMRNPQRVLNASFRMMMDNSGMSVADQIVINKDIVTPQDGNYTMTPKKIWYLKDKARSPADAFATFSTTSHQQELSAIFMMARQLADEETNMPLIAQGEQGAHITKTSSGMAMLMNSANIVLRKAVKNWDDDVTRPLIRRFYDWNMQFNNNPAIKGDFMIEARGSGALLVREKQQENLMVYANISAQNPELARRRDWAGLDKEIAKALEVPYENLTKDDAQIEEEMAAAAQQPDPAAQAAEMELQMKQMELQIEQFKAQAQAEARARDAQIREAEVQGRYQLEAKKMQRQYELDLASLNAKDSTAARQLEVRAAIDAQKIKADRDKAAAKTNIELTKTQLQAQNLAQGNDTF